MKLQDVIKNREKILDMGNSIGNNIIENVDVNIVAHFGNLTCFEIVCRNVCPMSGYNNTQRLGFLLKAFVELFDLSEEDGLRLSEIKNIPCRLVFEGKDEWGSRCIGFGNFMKDKFVLTEDFVKIDE